MSETNIANFLSKTISNFELDESLWDSNISNHFISRDKDYFGREKLDGETIIDYLQEQAKKLRMKVVLIGTEDFNWSVLGRPGLFKMLAIPSRLPNWLLNGTIEEIQKKCKIYEFCDLQYQLLGKIVSKKIDSIPKKRSNREKSKVRNIPMIILQRKTDNLPEYCLVPMSKLRGMPRDQYFILLHFFNELQIIRKEAIPSNDTLNQPNEDILTDENIKEHGEKRKMTLEDGHEDPGAQPSKKMKLGNGCNEEQVLSANVIDDSDDYECPVCLAQFSSRISSKGIPKAGLQMSFEWM